MSSHEEFVNNKLKELRLEENLIYMGGKAFERSEQIKAPWTEEQIKDLNARQANPNMHPYTCDRKSLKCQTRQFLAKDGVLIATKEGWICPCGEYKQDWY